MIEFRSVQKMYKDNREVAIKDASFKIERGEFVFFSGNSGAGKSTLLKMVYKEEMPTFGSVMVFGKDIRKLRVKHLRRNIGIVFQSFNLLPNKTAYENVAYVLECLGRNPLFVRRKAIECLSRMRVLHLSKKYPHQLSGGEQQRVSIARAIANNPEILICDEPTNNLDEENTKIIVDHLRELNQNGTTILMATHDKDVIQKMNKKIIFVENGHVVVKRNEERDFFNLLDYDRRTAGGEGN